jgi:hypothetical protein
MIIGIAGFCNRFFFGFGAIIERLPNGFQRAAQLLKNISELL